MATKLLVLSDRIYTLKALNFLRQKNLISRIISSYSSPATTFARYHNIPSYNIHTLQNLDEDFNTFNDDYDSQLDLDNLDYLIKIGKIKILDLGLQANCQDGQEILNEIAGDETFRLNFTLGDEEQEKVSSSSKLGPANSFETALINSVKLEKSLNFNLQQHQTNLEQSEFFNFPIGLYEIESLDNNDVIRNLGDKLFNLVDDNLEQVLSLSSTSSSSLSQTKPTFIENSKMNLKNLVYHPLNDSALDIFTKVTAFYGLFPILSKRDGITGTHRPYENYLDKNLTTKDCHLHAVRLCSDLVNKALNEYYLLKFKSGELEDEQETTETKCKQESTKTKNLTYLSSAGLPIGSIVIVNNINEFNIPNEMFTKQFTNTTNHTENRKSQGIMSGPRKAFFHTKDGKWLQIIAFSHNGKNIQPFKNLGLTFKSQNVHFKNRRFLPVRFPEKSVVSSFFHILSQSDDGKTRGSIQNEVKGLDLAILKHRERIFREIEQDQEQRRQCDDEESEPLTIFQ